MNTKLAAFGNGRGDMVAATQVFNLMPGDVQRLTSRLRELRVLAGSAWLSLNGKDVVLNAGDVYLFPSSKFLPSEDFAVVSPLRQASALLEVLPS